MGTKQKIGNNVLDRARLKSVSFQRVLTAFVTFKGPSLFYRGKNLLKKEKNDEFMRQRDECIRCGPILSLV